MIYYTEFGLTDIDIEKLISDRTVARQQKDFVAADVIREKIQRHYISIEDRADGTTHWYKFRRVV